MVEVRWTLQASDDLECIADFIAKDSIQYARLFVANIFEAIERLIQFLQSGRVVPELNDFTVRELIPGKLPAGLSDQKRLCRTINNSP